MRRRPLCAVVAVLLALTLPPFAAPLFAAPAAAGKKFAVLVGVNDYDHAQFPPLKWAVNDAVELAALLKAQGYQVTVLRSGAAQPNLAPTATNIRAQLTRVLEQCKRNDIVLVGLAGHGVQLDKEQASEPDDAFFCPQDARIAAGQRGTLVSLRRVYQQLDDSGAGVKLLVVDACRSLAKLPRGAKRSLDGANPVVPPRGVAALFSCSAGESAYELSELKHGVFFHVMLEGLRGKAAVDGEVTWDSLQQYVRKRVTREVAKLVGDASVRQTPALSCVELAGEPPVLARISSVPKSNSVAKNNPAPIGNNLPKNNSLPPKIDGPPKSNSPPRIDGPDKIGVPLLAKPLRGTVDVKVPAGRTWTATRVVLEEGMIVDITATGKIDATKEPMPRSYYLQVPPEGRAELSAHLPFPKWPGLSLVGRAPSGATFYVGARLRLRVDASLKGELLLGINDDVVQDNSGAWNVRLAVVQPVTGNLGTVSGRTGMWTKQSVLKEKSQACRR